MSQNFVQISKELLTAILQLYPAAAEVCWADSAQWKRHVGLSGGEIWRVPTHSGDLGVRLWPRDFPLSRLQMIHGMLVGLRDCALPIPIPCVHGGGGTWLAFDLGLVQVEPWLPGQADFASDPRPEKLAAACQFLAAFHRESAAAHGIRRGANPAIERRIAALRQHATRWTEYTRALETPRSPRERCAAEILAQARWQAPRWLDRLSAQPHESTCLVPCVRDIWHDHVLFQDVRVSGVVDFGSMDFDTPATDLARLLGSFVADDHDQRRWAVAHYLAIRPLAADELDQIDLLDRSGVLIAGLNWINWLWIERRSFEGAALLDRRLAAISERLSGDAFRESFMDA